MKDIVIDGVIGWDYLASNFRDAIKDIRGEDLNIQISSPGGSVFIGNTIYDLVLKYRRDYPNAKVIMTSYGVSASQASIIALAGTEHHVNKNTAYVIHNTYGPAVGDHREMRKVADMLDRLSATAAKLYAKKSGKSISEIRKKMDDETMFIGDEIVQYGFADKVIDSNDEAQDKQERIAFANLAINEAKKTIKNTKDFDQVEDLFKAAALINPQFFTEKQQEPIPASAGKNNSTEAIMTLEELKKNNPELYNEAVQIGRDEEHDRVVAHITMGKTSGSLDIAVKHIESKANFTQAISAEYMSAGMKNQALQNRAADGVTITPPAGEDNKADTAAYEKKLLEARGLK